MFDQKAWNASVEGKAAQARYRATPKGRAARARYRASPKGRAAGVRANATPKRKAKMRHTNLKKNHNLTEQMWDALFVSQGRLCGSCGAAEPGSTCGWSTDHDHCTGRVRGILCHRCNTALGYLEDPRLSLWTTYLEKHR